MRITMFLLSIVSVATGICTATSISVNPVRIDMDQCVKELQEGTRNYPGLRAILS